jgi:hypothetical protein
VLTSIEAERSAGRIEDARAFLQDVQQRFFDGVIRVALLELREGVRVCCGNRVFVETDSAKGVAQALVPAEAIALGLKEQAFHIQERGGWKDFDFARRFRRWRVGIGRHGWRRVR